VLKRQPDNQYIGLDLAESTNTAVAVVAATRINTWLLLVN